MDTVIINDQQLQKEIDSLKEQFSDTKEIYREVCVLLFFRYGITPTANKLYQYVRRGSMSAPADALNKFWLELREKSRVRIERSDIPENVAAQAGDLIANLWNEAQKAAQSGFSELTQKTLAQIQECNTKTESAEQKVIELQKAHVQDVDEIKNLQKKLSESENNHAVDMMALADKEKSLIALKNEKSAVEVELKRVQGEFSRMADKLNKALTLSDERYRELETKALKEIDRERQRSKNSDKELHKINQLLSKTKIDNVREANKKETLVISLRENIGTLKGQLKESQKNLTVAMKIIANYNRKGLKPST